MYEYQREILPTGAIQVKRTGENTEPHRHVLYPGDDLANEDEDTVRIANAVWTPEVIAACEVKQANATT